MFRGRTRLVLAAALLLGACKAKPTGELTAPNNAPAWESRYGVAFDDAYTREKVELSGRAPNDVLDQRLFAARLGHAALVMLVRVDQVWGKGRYQGRQDQYLDVTIRDMLVGELPGKKTTKQQLLRVVGEEELPGSLQGADMILFLRWAPDELPPFHHHLMPADEETVSWIRAMVDHAKDEGVLNQQGEERRRKGRKKKRRKGKNGE